MFIAQIIGQSVQTNAITKEYKYEFSKEIEYCFQK